MPEDLALQQSPGEVIKSPGARVTGGYEMTNIDIEKQI